MKEMQEKPQSFAVGFKDLQFSNQFAISINEVSSFLPFRKKTAAF